MSLSGDDWSALIVRSTGEAIIGFDPKGNVASWNAAAQRLYGYAADEILGRSGGVLVASSRRPQLREMQARALAGEVVSDAESEALAKDGASFPAALTIAPVRDRRGHIIGTSQVVRDDSERKRFEQRLRFFADHDPLTGLVNRRRFMQELARHTAFIGRYQVVGGALLIGDVDDLKSVNDTFGHGVGDELLKAVASAFRRRLRDTDVLARLGGDEFAILLPRARPAQAARVAEMLREAVADTKLTVKGRELRTTVSVGITPTDADADPEALLSAADRAMYRAKRAGRDRIATTTVKDSERHALLARREPVRLLDAIGEASLETYWQPIVELSTRAVRGHEVFVRIRNADQHLPPRAFIRAAERVGLLDRIDRHATETALSLLAGRPQGEHHLHVNLAGTARGKGEIVALLTEAASAGTFDPGRLTFEIADGAAAADVDAIREFAQAVREIGCHVALDHFGTGLASFTHLDKLPVDCLKIHGGLISGLRGSRTSRLIVKAIVDVAHGLGIEPIAQRVADRAAIHVLEHYGVRYGQGAALGEPSALLAERRAA